MSEMICQSCALPMDHDDLYGTNKDGTKNNEFCKHCFVNGAFGKDETMEEMIESCIPFVLNEYPSADAARIDMMEYFPTLKRWNNKMST